MAKTKRLRKVALLDVRKAYDSVVREKLKDIIRANFTVEQSNFILDLLDLQDHIILDVLGEMIKPSVGLLQGSPLSPVLFNIYINDILRDLKRQFTEAHIQAFADDLIALAGEMNVLQNVYDEITQRLNELGLKVNPDKCEHISDNPEDVVKDKESGTMLVTNTESKYIGQVIDSNGNATSSLKANAFGKLHKILSYTKSLSRRTRVKPFQIYMRSKINHLLPIISLSDKLEDSWKVIRKAIFDIVLQTSTMPRESAAILKLSYYDIIVRPIINLARDIEYESETREIVNYIKTS
jgi:hypothetical protein